ncbi:MAG: HEPN domain-containing protein [Bacteroidota bacterium]|nr:HEPN domain-containing protein [Bacteroidota bacterium]
MKFLFDENVTYLVKRAWEHLEIAESSYHSEKLNDSVLSLYNACYCMALAFLKTKQIDIRNQDEVKVIFKERFIRTGIIDQNFDKTYSKLYILRREILEQQSEFMDQTAIKPMISNTQLFLKELGGLILKAPPYSVE